MELRYNIIPKNRFNIICIDHTKIKKTNSLKPLKLFYIKFKIYKNVNLEFYNDFLNKYDIFHKEDNTLFTLCKLDTYDYQHCWFYQTFENLNEDIINYEKNENLKILNMNSDKLILPNLKFKDIFIILYNNGKL
tara:strand:- start:514 stop:915 length:402 start_codon:yes stop_codon:yes gene_type:complete